MPQWCGWLLGQHYCNLPATGIGGPLAYLGPRRRLKKILSHHREHRGCSNDSTGTCSLIKRCDLFQFLSLSAGLADSKVLACEICLSRAPFDYHNRGPGLALLLCLHLRRGPGAADLPQPVVNEFLLRSRPARRLHHMHWVHNAAVNPRGYRIVVTPVLSAGHALKDKAIPCAVFLRRQKFLMFPEELALYHVFIGEVRPHECVVPTFEWQHASGFLARKQRLYGHVPTHVHIHKKARLHCAWPRDLA